MNLPIAVDWISIGQFNLFWGKFEFHEKIVQVFQWLPIHNGYIKRHTWVNKSVNLRQRSKKTSEEAAQKSTTSNEGKKRETPSPFSRRNGQKIHQEKLPVAAECGHRGHHQLHQVHVPYLLVSFIAFIKRTMPL